VAGIGRRIRYFDGETVRHSGKRQPACVDHHLQARRTEADADAETASVSEMPWLPDAGASEVRRFFSAVTLVTIVRAAASGVINRRPP
jgi:hypothetical protein